MTFTKIDTLPANVREKKRRKEEEERHILYSIDSIYHQAYGKPFFDSERVVDTCTNIYINAQ